MGEPSTLGHRPTGWCRVSLPPGIATDAFDAALTKFRAAIGEQWVYTAEEDLRLYRDAYSPYWQEAEDRIASAAIAPASTAQVQAVVRIASESSIPLFPISTGRNLGYGGSAPNLSGSVVLDLLRMDRVLEVDDARHFAVVEPGVSYFDLYRHIQERNLNVWIDCPEPGWGSPIGNSLDRGVGFTAAAYRDHFGSHCGMEVVLPDGELLRTGMGAMPDNACWHDYPYGFGPSLDGLFAQGNLGVVTKMGVWLYPPPESILTATVYAPLYRDMIPLVDTLNYLEHSGIVNGMPGIDSPLLGTYEDAPNPEITRLIANTSELSSPELDAYARRQGKPCWRLQIIIYGPPEVVAAQWAYTKRKFSAAVAGATFDEATIHQPPFTDADFTSFEKVNAGIPNLAIFRLGARSSTFPKPTEGHMWFSPLVPRSGQVLLHAQRVFARVSLELGAYFGANVALPLCFLPRSFALLFPIFITHDPEQNRKGRETFKRLVDVAAQHGWGEYRTPVGFQDFVMSQMSFNNHAHRRFCERVKDAIDPRGIIAPGRYGIWPKHMRSSTS